MKTNETNKVASLFHKTTKELPNITNIMLLYVYNLSYSWVWGFWPDHEQTRFVDKRIAAKTYLSGT